MILVVDLDDTLVNTSLLNNDAYNYALEQYGYDVVESEERLTREELSFVKSEHLRKIIRCKQNYFKRHWLSYRVVMNNTLLEIISKNGKNNSYLWTSANKKRAEAIVNACKLNQFFNKIIFDNKKSFVASMYKLKDLTHSNEFIIYENNDNFFCETKFKSIDCIKSNFFNVKAYKILL
jgi:beta-phosphoglucomutase-like phosphatase (HAD superfamily)